MSVTVFQECWISQSLDFPVAWTVVLESAGVTFEKLYKPGVQYSQGRSVFVFPSLAVFLSANSSFQVPSLPSHTADEMSCLIVC